MAAVSNSLPGSGVAELPGMLRGYYRHRSIRARMREFLGKGPGLKAGAIYITAADGQPEYTGPTSPSRLADYLDAGLEVDRSLWDSRSLLVDLDLEYTNFDHPAAAWANPERAFSVQAPVMESTLRILGRAGIEPLILVSGRGYHLVWSVGRKSAVFGRIARLGHVPYSLEARYAQARSPSGESVEPALGHAFAGLGMIAEYVADRVLADSMAKSVVPVEITAIEVGPGPCGREIVSFDISEYGDPLHRRHLRLPFSVYLKPRQFVWLLGEHAVRRMLPIFEIPLAGMTPQQAIQVARSPEETLRLSKETHVSIPDRSENMEGLVDEYEASALAAFHREFYSEPWVPFAADQVWEPLRIPDAPACLNWLLEHPNDLLLRPAEIQFVARILTALGWSPHAIVDLIAKCYLDPELSEQWVSLDPLNRAIFYTRLFTGMVATGADKLIDLNCVSQREKGYCMVAECPSNLATWRDKLLERRNAH